MRDETTGLRLEFRDGSGPWLLISNHQKAEIESLLQDQGWRGDWFPIRGGIQTYSDFVDEPSEEITGWTLFLGPEVEIALAQAALDRVE